MKSFVRGVERICGEDGMMVVVERVMNELGKGGEEHGIYTAVDLLKSVIVL